MQPTDWKCERIKLIANQKTQHVTARILFFFSSRRRHTRSLCDWSSDVCSSDLLLGVVFASITLGYLRGADAEKLRDALGRSEERRVGKECRSRWSPYH